MHTGTVIYGLPVAQSSLLSGAPLLVMGLLARALHLNVLFTAGRFLGANPRLHTTDVL